MYTISERALPSPYLQTCFLFPRSFYLCQAVSIPIKPWYPKWDVQRPTVPNQEALNLNLCISAPLLVLSTDQVRKPLLKSHYGKYELITLFFFSIMNKSIISSTLLVTPRPPFKLQISVPGIKQAMEYFCGQNQCGPQGSSPTLKLLSGSTHQLCLQQKQPRQEASVQGKAFP